jgi:hypothetical protein
MTGGAQTTIDGKQEPGNRQQDTGQSVRRRSQ